MMPSHINGSNYPRLAIYSQDGFGLGHMRRTNSIAREFLQAFPQASVLTLSDSPLGQLFGTEKNHDYLKLPSIVKAGPGDWRPVKLPMPFDKVLVMRKNLIRSAVLCFEPHILLVDHMPHGAMGELLPTLEGIEATNSPTCVVLGLRDILDAPDVIERRWRAEGAYKALKAYYNRVLIYGMQEVYDLAEHYRFQPEITDLLRYCGFVCTPSTARYTARARAQTLSNAPEGTKLILVMAGGGADAFPMMRSVLEALPLVLSRQPCMVMMITGPFMPAEQRHDLEARGRRLPVRVRNTVSDVLSYLDAADLVISMAGYNSTMEILRSRKPAILIPRKGPSAEQRTRARLFAERGWVQFIDPVSGIEPSHLASSVLDSLENGMQRSRELDQRPDLGGVRAAVEQLASMLPEELGGGQEIWQAAIIKQV
jgi:predicted glycosyltransferase